MSYLHDRTQFLANGDSVSITVQQSNNVWVPQGSVLGLLRFLFNISDLSESSKDLGRTVLFADDMGCSVSGPNDLILRQNICQGIGRIMLWFESNHLTANFGYCHSRDNKIKDYEYWKNILHFLFCYLTNQALRVCMLYLISLQLNGLWCISQFCLLFSFVRRHCLRIFMNLSCYRHWMRWIHVDSPGDGGWPVSC